MANSGRAPRRFAFLTADQETARVSRTRCTSLKSCPSSRARRKGTPIECHAVLEESTRTSHERRRSASPAWVRAPHGTCRQASRAKQRAAPDRAVLDVAPASALGLPPALAEHARHFAAGDHLRACRQEIFEERAAAVAIASDIDELGHLDSRAEHAVAASLWEGGAAAAYVIFQAETRVQPGIGPAPSSHPCPARWHCRTPWPTSSESGSERGSDVVKRCQKVAIGGARN